MTAPLPPGIPRGAAVTALALLLVAPLAAAAITFVSLGTLTVSTLAPATHFVKGEGGENGKHIGHLTVSANGTRFSAGVKPRAGAEVVVKDVVRLVSDRGAPIHLTLRGSPVLNPQVTAFQWTVRDGTTPVAVLDYKTASPTATVTLPAGATYLLDLRVELAEGAGKDNAAVSFTMDLEVA